MRCAYDNEPIEYGEKVYSIGNDNICEEHIIEYLNQFNYDTRLGCYVIEDEEITEDELEDWLWDHYRTCDENDNEEDGYDPRYEPECWEDR